MSDSELFVPQSPEPNAGTTSELNRSPAASSSVAFDDFDPPPLRPRRRLHTAPHPPPPPSVHPGHVDRESDSDLDDDLFNRLPSMAPDPLLSDSPLSDTDLPTAASQDNYSWRIDHSAGDHKLRAKHFIEKTQAPNFDSQEAIDMLHRLYTIDYGSTRAGSKPAALEDEYHPVFFLDYISIIGRPLMPITQMTDRFFDNVTISFQYWRTPYSAKHLYDLPFHLEHRTFRIATAATRETWFIVMHPVVTPTTRLPSSRQDAYKQKKKSSQSSALRSHHAQTLASYIKDIFLSGELLGERVEPSWKLDGPLSQVITSNKWTAFQERFMAGWDDFVQSHSYDDFWLQNQPAFHAYDLGANIEMPVSDSLRALPQEVRQRPLDGQDSSDSDDDTPPARARESSQSSPAPDNGTEEDAQQDLYAGGLGDLLTELGRKYTLDHIGSISYALAVDIHCLDAASPDPDQKHAYCMLADRNVVVREYGGPRELTFYPLAFHQAYGNFSSPRPPAFLNHVLAIMGDNMSFHNDGADVLKCGYFQAYSGGVKRSIRHAPDDLLVTKGIATAALTLPSAEARGAASVRNKQQRLLQRLRGDLTQDNPDASRPFAREMQRIEQSIAEEEFAFRMEQIVSIDVSALTPRRKTFQTVLRPIFQLMRFYLREAQQYTHLLRCFRPTVFPQILVSFARLFDLAMTEMQRRYEIQGSKGLGIALAEGVAALDRLGHYCFTGSPKALMPSVMEALGSISSMQKGAWPHISAQMLDLREKDGVIDVMRWPRNQDGRPIFMHVAALAFHYGQEVAASRHSLLWFRDLGAHSIRGPSGAVKFLDDLFQSLWIPQMAAFTNRQLQQRLGRRNGTASSRDALETLQKQRLVVQEWAESKDPFMWSNYEAIYALAGEQSSTSISIKTRRDFSNELYESCATDGRASQAYSPNHSTWYSVLQAVFMYTSSRHVTKEQWLGALATAMLSNRIECMPGSHLSRLTHRRVVRLVGSASSSMALSARPGSLKRAAIEAVERRDRPVKMLRIDLGCSIPFRTIPPIIELGFQKLDKAFVRGDPKVLEHYHMARIILEQCLGDPICDVMLMMILTLSSSSVTPTVAVKSRGFAVGERKDPALFSANLTTRMLWFLCPEKFPWEKDDGMVLRVSEMTKKIEHKGVNNRVLRELGWVQVVKGHRDSPRNSELSLWPRTDLLSMRRELLPLMKNNAEAFIARIFRSHDSIWLERCALIVRDVD